jgi:hypothetical protein
MSFLTDIFAPSTTDCDYFVHLVRDVSPGNVESMCEALSALLNSSSEITTDSALPLLAKLETFTKTGKIEAATLVVDLLAKCRQTFFRESQLHPFMEALIRDDALLYSKFTPPFLSLCTRSLANIHALVNDPFDLVTFGKFASEPFVSQFLIRAIQLIPDLKTRLVFDGLLECIMSAAVQNISVLELLSWIVDDPLVRQYIHDMHHIPSFGTVLFESNVSDSCLKVFRALLNPHDLVHLNSIQQQLFDFDVPRRLVETLATDHLSDEFIRNVSVCLADSIQYFPMEELPFSLDPLFSLLVRRAGVRTALL